MKRKDGAYTEVERMLSAYGEAVRAERLNARETAAGAAGASAYGDERAIRETVAASKSAFFDAESRRRISYAGFVMQQVRYVSKRLWALQFIVIAAVYILITAAGSDIDIRRALGAAAPLIVILVIPELWKNRAAGSMEIEAAAFYSLRQIYAARMTAFAFADGMMLTVFIAASAASGSLGAEEMLIQFLLPMTVTCCICLRMLYARSRASEYMAVFLSLMWTGFWLVVIVRDDIYDMISMPLWALVCAAAAAYLVYVARKAMTECGRLFETGTVWD